MHTIPALGNIKKVYSFCLSELNISCTSTTAESRAKIWYQKMHLSPRWLRLLSVLRHGSVVVDFLFIVTPIVGLCNCSMFCCTLLYVHSSIAIILMGKRELIALLNLSSWCIVMVERLFLAVPQGCLQFVIVVFPDHTHLLFSNIFTLKNQRELVLRAIKQNL